MVEPTFLPSLFLGLADFVVLAADEDDGELFVLVESTADRAFCRACGVRAVSKGRARVQVRDVPAGGRPVRLVWLKRRWRCEEPECPVRSWTETHDQVRARAVLTERARRWAVEQIGRLGRSVACVAVELGVGWHTVMRAVVEIGTVMIDADDRLERVTAVGLDEHNFLRGSFTSPTSWVTGFVDLRGGRLLDVVENRTADAVQRWIGAQPDQWRRQIDVAAMDPYHGYALALRRALPDAEIVVDHFHIIRLANGVVDETRRRVQQETTGHRGRKGDPLYDVRRLLLVSRQRLTGRAVERIETAWRDGDPLFEVECAWVGKEMLRDVYAAADLVAATVALDEFLAWADTVGVPELDRLAGTIRHWRHRVLAYHRTRLSNGRTEAMNLLVKKVKRVGFGFRNFTNYRIRLLLHCGIRWETPATARIRGRAPRSAA